MRKNGNSTENDPAPNKNWGPNDAVSPTGVKFYGDDFGKSSNADRFKDEVRAA